MLNKLPRRIVVATILASIIGGLMSALAFQMENPSGLLEFPVLPGTIAFLLVSGGHAGAPQWATRIAPSVAVGVNMFAYAIVAFGFSKILHLMTRKETNQ
jgi:hypothetical protein